MLTVTVIGMIVIKIVAGIVAMIGSVVTVGAIVSHSRGVQGQGRGAGIHKDRAVTQRWGSAVETHHGWKDLKDLKVLIVVC